MVIIKEKLIEMVKKGVSDKEIVKELGIQRRASLRKMYYEALVEAGKIKDILTERELRKAVRGQRAVTVGKRGTILLSRKLLVDRPGFKTGDAFRVAKRKDSIIFEENSVAKEFNRGSIGIRNL
jgi:hypothetical protein